MLTLTELVQSAREEFQDYLNGWEVITETTVADRISEIADNQIPVYTTQLLQVAMSNLRLVNENPEWSNGDQTPEVLIQGNIYQYIRDALWNEYYNKTQ